ncbi:hypothetical protein GGI12_000422 [Dipsacomyces acuminosporus]|nr:hypothetical protein GGI12_000422 [Dipsacomyces acuminosporus]
MDTTGLPTLSELAERAKSSEVQMTEKTCLNMSHFKGVMKQLRKVDDNIMLRMNNTNTASDSECLAFFHALRTAYMRRDNDISMCVDVMDRTIAETEQRAASDDTRAKRMLFTQRTQRDWIENERHVEDIVRQRSLDVFRSRCQFFDFPPEFERFLNRD